MERVRLYNKKKGNALTFAAIPNTPHILVFSRIRMKKQ